MTDALTRHTLSEVLELNFILDQHDQALADDAHDGGSQISRLLTWIAGGYRY